MDKRTFIKNLAITSFGLSFGNFLLSSCNEKIESKVDKLSEEELFNMVESCGRNARNIDYDFFRENQTILFSDSYELVVEKKDPGIDYYLVIKVTDHLRSNFNVLEEKFKIEYVSDFKYGRIAGLDCPTRSIRLVKRTYTVKFPLKKIVKDNKEFLHPNFKLPVVLSKNDFLAIMKNEGLSELIKP